MPLQIPLQDSQTTARASHLRVGVAVEVLLQVVCSAKGHVTPEAAKKSPPRNMEVFLLCGPRLEAELALEAKAESPPGSQGSSAKAGPSPLPRTLPWSEAKVFSLQLRPPGSLGRWQGAAGHASQASRSTGWGGRCSRSLWQRVAKGSCS